jgi:hypothetical protein
VARTRHHEPTWPYRPTPAPEKTAYLGTNIPASLLGRVQAYAVKHELSMRAAVAKLLVLGLGQAITKGPTDADR